MKISHNNHSYLSPSKLSSLGSVKTLLSPTNLDDTYPTTDLDKLIIDKSDSLTSTCNEDETNDNILSSPAYNTSDCKSPYQDFSLTPYDNSLSYLHYNGLNDAADDPLKTPKSATSFRFSGDYSGDAPSTPRSTIATACSIATIPKPTTPDYSMKDFKQLNRIPNVDDLLSYTATITTTTTSSTLNSWNEANSEFARKEIVQSATSTSTRKPLLSTQNRFLSLSISPPLSRRQDMPVLRGTFVSL